MHADVATVALDAFVAGVYLFVGAFHLQIYLRRREMATYLWLALTCAAALAVDVSGLWERFHPGVPLPLAVAIPNYLGVSGASALLLEFIGTLTATPRSRGRRAAQAATVVTAGAAAFVRPLLPLVLVMAFGLLLLGVRTLRQAARRGDPEARTVLGGFLLLAASLTIDIAMSLELLPYVPGMPVLGFSALFLAMAVSLSNRFERTHRELDALRVDLERRVDERTHALERANRRLRHYFPARVVERILEAQEEEKPRTERRVVTILFADLAGFTTFSDGADPDDVRMLVNEYISAMFAEIAATDGTVDKVMGDGIMAFWGAPAALAPHDQARRAVATAAAMQRRLGALSEGWAARGLSAFQARIGIHQDSVAVGDIGTEELWSFTVIGSGVNLAQRLESACPPGSVLVSANVRRHLPEGWIDGGPRAITLKGLKAPVDAFAVATGAVGDTAAPAA